MSVRILVVDDNVKVRDGVRFLLQNHAEWEVCGEAGDGVEAIEKYRQLNPDLLVADVSMPRLNGLDASLEILKLSPKALILLYTSYLTSQLIEIAHKAGIRGTVSKDAMIFWWSASKHCFAVRNLAACQIQTALVRICRPIFQQYRSGGV